MSLRKSEEWILVVVYQGCQLLCYLHAILRTKAKQGETSNTEQTSCLIRISQAVYFDVDDGISQITWLLLTW